MAAAVGRDGTISVAGATSAPTYIDSWTLNGEIGVADITAFGDASRTRANTIRDWNVTCNGTLDQSNDDQLRIHALVTSTSDPGNVALRLYDQSAAYWSGNSRLASFTINSAVADKVNITWNFQGNGILSRTS